jgi:hypothetical protein
MREELYPIDLQLKRRNIRSELVKAEPKINWEGNSLVISISFNDEVEGECELRLSGKIETLEAGATVANSNDTQYFCITRIDVDKIVRGMELGTLLYEILDEELTRRGIRHIFGIINTTESLKSRAKAFGKNNLIFYKSDKPIDIDHNTDFETACRLDMKYMFVGVDLDKIDTPGEKEETKPRIKFIKTKR